MSQPILPLGMIQNNKSNCCQSHLLPLIQKIEDLQNQLRLETGRRENDYNDLLRLFVKEKAQIVGVKSPQSFVLIQQSRSKVQKSQEIFNKKQNIKNTLNRSAGVKRINFQKDIEHLVPKRDVKNKGSGITIEERTKRIEQDLQHQQNEFDKMKELNKYLMEQMLIIFQKIKGIEVKEQTTLKQIQSLETISSMVLQTEARQHHIKIINNLNNKKLDLLQQELSALIQKVGQHENVLTELIQLTKEVSSHIILNPQKAKIDVKL